MVTLRMELVIRDKFDLGYFPALQAYVLKSSKVWTGYEY